MVSRRDYLTITSMMLVLFCLFQLPQVAKMLLNPYGVNQYAEEFAGITKENIFQKREVTVQELAEGEEYVLYVGTLESGTGRAARSWAEYTKRTLAHTEKPNKVKPETQTPPEVILIDAEQSAACADWLEGWHEAGVPIIFCELPSAEVLEGNETLRKLLGIRFVQASETDIKGVFLYDGFFLGGPELYQAENEEEEKRMDLELTVPWYLLHSGAEVYLAGILPDEVLTGETYRNEKFPPLLWRYSDGGANVFAVNGDYGKELMGIGVLDAFMVQNRDYSLTPIINAQVLTVANFPGFADENRETLERLYSSGMSGLCRDILWPELESLEEYSEFPLSTFFQPQRDYEDDAQPDGKQLDFYLQLLREKSSEAGISLQHEESVMFAKKWREDRAFLQKGPDTYRYNAAYVTEKEAQELADHAEAGALIRAVSGTLPEEEELFQWLDKDTLLQRTTQDLFDYPYSAELTLRSLESALGYSNALLDMQRILWPENEDEVWEKLYEKASANLITYWKPYRAFDKMNLSESDAKLRNFLSIGCRERREGDTITAEIEGAVTETSFLLRTTRENVRSVEGGDFTKLEDGVWLIRTKENRISIQLEENKHFFLFSK